MVNVKDLGKEDYFMYSTTMRNASSEYTSYYWFCVIFSLTFLVDIVVNGFQILNSVGLTLMLLMFGFNYVQVSKKFKHIKRLFNVEGFSIIN